MPNPIIYAEVSIGMATIEGIEEALPMESFPRLPTPLEAASLAGKAFLRYTEAPRGQDHAVARFLHRCAGGSRRPTTVDAR